ncbi:unnamed protein product [Rotaria sp. Silwood2]|nr:unnamed protein product [Rotaria sp. Silwood2]
MNEHNIHPLDLPNEILFLILKILDKIDVLFSLLGINNQRLDIIAQEQIFINLFNFVSSSQSADEISSIPGLVLDRFCIDILPRVHQNVKSLILEPVSLECILRAGSYPNLTELRLFNFSKTVVSHCVMDDTLFGHIGKQITDLILISNENNIEITPKEYTKNVYAIMFTFFENLKHPSIVLSSFNDYRLLSLYNISPMTFSLRHLLSYVSM